MVNPPDRVNPYIGEPIPTHLVAGTDDRCFFVEVRLDGKALRDVVEVNTTEGWAIRYARDANNHLIYDPATGELVTAKESGNFSLHWLPSL